MTIPIAALLSAGGSIYDFINQMNAQDEASDLAQQGFNFTEDQIKQLMEILTAPQRDAYGNELMYRPGIGWDYKLTPQTRDILAGEQKEQIKSLTEDALRNRQYRRRMEDFSKEAGQNYEDVLAEYKYGEKPDEASIIDDLTRLMVINRGKGLEEGGEVLAKQALRAEANPAVLGDIVRNIDETYGKGLEEAILKGRQAGSEEYRNRAAFRDKDLQSWLNNFMSVARGQPQANIIDPSIGENLSNLRTNAQSSLSSGLISGTGLMNSAFSNLISRAGATPPSISPVTSSIGKLFGGFSGAGSSGSDSILGSAGTDTFGGTYKAPQTSGIVYNNDPLYINPFDPENRGDDPYKVIEWYR